MLRRATLLASLILVSTFIGSAAEAFPAPAPAAASKPAVQTPGKANLAERDKSEGEGGVTKQEQHHVGSTSQQSSGS